MAAPGARRSRPPAGQHFLGRSSAHNLVRLAGTSRDDLVVEVGAGTGALTRELAEVARRVIAIELDPHLAAGLRRRFDEDPRVTIVQGDALTTPLPDHPFRAFGNVPFGITTALLCRLLKEPRLLRADLVVQLEVARKRTMQPPRNLLGLSWAPWWTFERGRRIPAHAFHPRPRVDAAVLTVNRRGEPLLEEEERASYLRLLRLAFRRAGSPLPTALGPLRRARHVRTSIRNVGVDPRARPIDLAVEEWIALFRELEGTSATRARAP